MGGGAASAAGGLAPKATKLAGPSPCAGCAYAGRHVSQIDVIAPAERLRDWRHRSCDWNDAAARSCPAAVVLVCVPGGGLGRFLRCRVSADRRAKWLRVVIHIKRAATVRTWTRLVAPRPGARRSHGRQISPRL